MENPKQKYSLKEAERLQWSSVSLHLNSDRVRTLDRYIVGPSVLDIGCAAGGYSDYLGKQGHHVYGIDISYDLLQVGRQRGTSTRFVCGDALTLPFGDRSFDTTVLFDILEHVDDLALLKEAVRVSCRRLIIAVPLTTDPKLHYYGFLFRHYEDRTHLRTYTLDSLIDLCKRGGLKTRLVYRDLPININGLISCTLDEGYFLTPLFKLLFRRRLGLLKFREIYTDCVAICDLADG